jgi:hypothetical protein
VFLPVMASLAETVADVATWFAELPQPVQTAVSGLSGIAGVGLLAGGAMLLLAPRIMETYRSFQLLNTAHPRLAAGLGKLGVAAGVAVGLAVLGTAVSALDDAMAPAPGTMEKYTAALLGMDDGVASLDKRFDALDAGLSTDIDGFTDAIKRLTDPANEERLNDFGASLFNVATFGTAGTGDGAASRRRVLEEVKGLDSALALIVQKGNPDLAAQQFQTMADAAERQGVSVAELKELFPGYADALKGISNEQQTAAETARIQGDQAKVLAQDLTTAYGSLQGYAAALGMSEEATKELIDQSNALGESLGGFIDPLGTYTGLLESKAQAEADAANATAEETGAASKSWEDFVGSVNVSFDEYMAALEEQVAAQAEWQVNMLALSSRVSAGTLAELSKMGPEGARLVADLVNRSDAELGRFDDVTRARSKEATDAWGAQLTLAAPVLAQIGKTAGQGVVDELAKKLAAGTTTVAAIAQQYGVALAGGINPILTSLGKRPIAGVGGRVGGSTEYADGGYTGPGGKYDPAGIVHAGEYVFTQEQTRRLGVTRLEQIANNGYASGGFVDAASVPRPRSTAPYGPPISSGGDATMEKAYEEVAAWMRANGGGIAGTGAVGGAWGSIWQYVKSRVPQARINSTFRPGDPGYHGRGKAIDFGFGSGPGGAGSAGLALINRVLHDGVGRNLAELIYTGIGDDRPDLKNGRPLNYGPATNAAHRNHVHAASYETGTSYVPRTGPALLHKGEAVIPAGVNAALRAMPMMPVGAGSSRGGPVAVSVAPPQVTVHFLVDGQEFRGMTRAEINGALGDIADAVHYAGG